MLTALAAAPTHPYGYGPGPFPFFFLVPLLWLAVLVVLALLVRRGVRRRLAEYGGPAAGPRRSPEAALSHRFADGEIDAVEYRERLAVLRDSRPTKR